MGRPSQLRQIAEHMPLTFQVSERRACRTLRYHRSACRYQSCKPSHADLRARIKEIAAVRVRYGYRRIQALLRREGHRVGKHLVYRLYREEGLVLRRYTPKRRKMAIQRQARFKADKPNQIWSLDFVADQLTDGRTFRALTVVDVYTREALAIEVGQRLKGENVVEVLNRIKQTRGSPRYLFCDNGSEFSGRILDLWANRVRIDFSRPGKPTDNAYIESFNSTFRAECLNAHWFTSMPEAVGLIEAWRQDYNESRPHRALGERPSAEFAVFAGMESS